MRVSSIDRVLTALHHAVDALRHAKTHARTAVEKADDGGQLGESLGVRSVPERFARIIEGAERVEAMLATSVELAQQAIAQAEAARSGRTAGGTATAPDNPPAETPREPVPVAPGWKRPFEVPEHIRSAGARLRPRPAGDRRPTAGVFQGEVIHSGGKDTSIAADLDHVPLPQPPVTLWQHVESKVAARMRQDQLRHAEVAIDNTVCGSNPHDLDYPWGCERTLPSILPAGSRLVVWVTRDGGQSWWRRAYTGTGERIKP